MGEKFPTVELTQLQINPTDATGSVPANQCLPCTEATPQANDPDADNYCDPSNSFMAWDFSDDSATTSPVSSSSTSLWFKAGKCGTSMDISDDGTIAEFKTDIGKPAIIDSATGIVTEATLLETDITCQYPSTIAGIPMDPEMKVVADASQVDEK